METGLALASKKRALEDQLDKEIVDRRGKSPLWHFCDIRFESHV